MAEWIHIARAERAKFAQEATNIYNNKLNSYYVRAKQDLMEGREKVCIPHEFAHDVAKMLILDGCKVLHIAFSSGNDIYKVDF